MKNTMVSLSLAFPILLALSQVARAEEAAKAPTPIAKIGTTILTEEDLRKDMGMSLYEAENQLYQIKKNWVDQKAKVLLMTQAAKDAKLSLQEWTKKEIDEKVTPPTQQEIDQWAPRFGVQGSTKQPTEADYTAMKEKAKQYLQQQRRSAKETEVYQRLVAQSGAVELLFAKPDAPHIDVSYTADDPVRGPKSAPITIIEFTDFQCPYCKRSQDTLKKVLEVYGDQVKIVEKQFPLSFHNRAKPAAEAVLCAKEQGKFWEMHSKVFPSQSLEDADFTRFATEIGLNMKKFNKCYTEHRMAPRIDADMAEGQRVGVRGTPHFFINGRPINGAQPFEAFKAIIDEELSKKK